jgi:thymidine phosphorylase
MLFKQFVDVLSIHSSEKDMMNVIDHARSGLITNEEIACLAEKLAYSGDCLKRPDGLDYADIPSTGGPSSLSTLLCPLILKELGFVIPKLSVPGRPAGGVDVLYQLDNYKIDFETSEIEACIQENQYCHFLVGSEHAPLDNLLFNFRSKIGAKAIPSLVIASILSKKIAMGLNVAGLDVRLSKYGNFGTDWETAELNSRRFIDVASQIGIAATCFLNDFNVLQQPYVGRGEALVALWKIFYDSPEEILADHYYRCVDMAVSLSQYNNKSISTEHIISHFKENLIAQGSTFESFIKKVDVIQQGHIYNISALEDGFLKIDLEKIRDCIVWQQDNFVTTLNRFPDPCGIIFKKHNNQFVGKGEIILTYRTDYSYQNEFKNLLLSAIEISSRYQPSLTYKIIN